MRSTAASSSRSRRVVLTLMAACVLVVALLGALAHSHASPGGAGLDRCAACTVGQGAPVPAVVRIAAPPARPAPSPPPARVEARHVTSILAFAPKTSPPR